MGLALLLLGAWISLSSLAGPSLILGGPWDGWIRLAGCVGTVLGAGMVACGGALLS